MVVTLVLHPSPVMELECTKLLTLITLLTITTLLIVNTLLTTTLLTATSHTTNVSTLPSAFTEIGRAWCYP